MAFEIENGVLTKYIPEDGETEIVIPEGVRSIGNGAFRQNKQLTAVTLPESLTSIGNAAFYGCRNLRSIRIPEGVTSIGMGAFRSCRSLTSFTLPEGITSIEKFSFFACTSLKHVMIPESVKHIGGYAFGECSSLSGLMIPEGVTEIGDAAFQECRSIRMFGIIFAPEDFYRNDYIKVRKMLRTGDFSIKNSREIKFAAAVGFWLKTGDERAEAFLKSNASGIIPFLIENGNTDVICKMLNSGKFITADNIDKFIECAIAHTQSGGNPEIQTMLLHYKSEVLGYADPAETFKL